VLGARPAGEPPRPWVGGRRWVGPEGAASEGAAGGGSQRMWPGPRKTTGDRWSQQIAERVGVDKDVSGAPNEATNSTDRRSDGSARANRVRRPNSCVSGPEWVA
jgi:hypothetical protein